LKSAGVGAYLWSLYDDATANAKIQTFGT